MCTLRHVSVCISGSCMYMRRCKWLLLLSYVIAMYPLAAFFECAANCHCRENVPLLPNKCFSLLSMPFIEVITGAYESEMNESVRGWMGGHGLTASEEWGCINSSPTTDGGSLSSTIISPHTTSSGFCPHPAGKCKPKRRGQFFTQVMCTNSHK